MSTGRWNGDTVRQQPTTFVARVVGVRPPAAEGGIRGTRRELGRPEDRRREFILKPKEEEEEEDRGIIKILESGHPLSQYMQSVLVMDRDIFGSRAKEDVGVC